MRYARSTRTHASEETPLPVSKPERDYPLPDSPAPPPYMSPSPDSEQALLLQQRQQQQIIPMTIDGPDLSSVDEILMSQTKNQESASTSTATSSNHQSASSSPSTQPNSQLRSNSPGQQKRQRLRGEVLLRTKAPDLLKEIEEVMVKQHSLEIETSELPSQMTVSLSPRKPSPENTSVPVSNMLPVSEVDASVEARHQRRGMERHLHQSQKRLNKMLRGESRNVPIQQTFETDLTGSPPAPTLDEFPVGINPEDFAQEKIEIDPRNLINAPSPVYDKLVEGTLCMSVCVCVCVCVCVHACVHTGSFQHSIPSSAEPSNDEDPTTASGNHPGSAPAPLDIAPDSRGAAMPTANRFMPTDVRVV